MRQAELYGVVLLGSIRYCRRQIVPVPLDQSRVARMRGDEIRVAKAYAAWLEADGWDARREINFVDVYAQRGDEQIFAEVKGRTTDPGLDVDTLYGQLLRRMTDAHTSARYAVVVPTLALKAALRVPEWVRDRLAIDVCEVDDEGHVEQRR